MKFTTSASSSISLLLLSLQFDFGLSQGGVQTCTGVRTQFRSPTKGSCLPWNNQRSEQKSYPNDFGGILNKVEIYQCPTVGKRVIISNGVPDHDVTLQNRNAPCEVNWAVEMPLYPQVASMRTEVPIRGMIAMAINGVPAYGPQEADSLNAVDGDGSVPGARFWYGHNGGNLVWHFHNPQMGKETFPSPTTLLGYAMDGFPIYGPLDDSNLGKLDTCNGMVNDQGNYEYHARAISQVDGTLEYCNGNSPETNWNYILGCYSGEISGSKVYDSTSYNLDSDCVLDPDPVYANKDTVETPTEVPKSPTEAPKSPTGVNIIVMQPDDLVFFDEWGAPPNNPSQSGQNTNIPSAGLPNMERLRLNGLQMMQAYTTSPMCGTSRYSTVTGKYPSRAETNSGGYASTVTIPTTKLQGDDCARENMAAQFQTNGYRTAMIGKWHLSRIDTSTYTYESAVNTVKQCGWSTVAGLYIENLRANPNQFNNYSDGTFSHNMEWITHEAIKVINENSDKPFFMYFNPTVPHASNSINMALNDFKCTDTAAGKLPADLMIPGMTEEYGSCALYRQSIKDRSSSEDDWGTIWLDDAVGALLKALESKGILEDTIFLFQEDHGVKPKGTILEGGVRIPQFVHYPAGIGGGSKLNVPVSTIDISATMFDFAGITPSYTLDGLSWKKALENSEQEAFLKSGRCLFFEHERDRAVRCGCYKFLSIFDIDASTTAWRGWRFGIDIGNENLFDLCGGTSEYITARENNMETSNILLSNPNDGIDVRTSLKCHLTRTDGTNQETEDCNLSDEPLEAGGSQRPTSNPTEDPTGRPSTKNPTFSPTSTPTTKNPTKNPTRSPTFLPTLIKPTIGPPTKSPGTPSPPPEEETATGSPIAPSTEVPPKNSTSAPTSSPIGSINDEASSGAPAAPSNLTTRPTFSRTSPPQGPPTPGTKNGDSAGTGSFKSLSIILSLVVSLSLIGAWC